MAIENRSDAAEIRAAASVLLERMQFLRQAGLTFAGARDIFEVLGYAKTLTSRDYRARYARGGIAQRIVEVFPKSCWRGGAELVEDEDPKTLTTFEKAWEDLEKRLSIWSKLLRADIMAGLSTYSVILIGAPGAFDQELPKGKPESLLYLTPFMGGGGPILTGDRTVSFDADATIRNLVNDTQNERFGLPEFYQLRRLDVSAPDFQVPVHWTRIIHIAEGLLEDEIFGKPRLESCWNNLDDLDKIIGGGSEAFWLRANQGIQLDVDKDITLEEKEKEALRDQADEYQHQMRRMLRTRGVTVTPLGSDVANFSNPADAVVTQIAGTLGIPKRILQGSELGELASSQDRESWRDQVNGRREGFCGPSIVRPLVDRLIKYGYLPTPKDYDIVWPEINTLSDAEKAAGALSWAQTATAAGPVFTVDEVRDFWYAMEPLPKPKMDAEGNPISEDGQPLAPTVDAKTGLPIKVPPAPILGKHPVTGLPVEVDTKTGKPANTNKGFARGKFPRAAETHSFSSTQVNLPWELANELRAFAESIDNDALTADGIEEASHVTVKYGIHTNDAEEVQRSIEGYGPIYVTLGEIDAFQNDEHDVLIVRVNSEDLVTLNAHLSTVLDVTDTHPSYQPHVTLAYLWPGQSKPWIGDDRFSGKSFVADTVIFSSADDVVTPLRTAARGNFGHAGRPGKKGGSAPKEAISDSLTLITGDFNFSQLVGDRRFMFHPATGLMIFGHKQNAGAGMSADGLSHAQELAEAQKSHSAPGNYDQYMRGWVEGPSATKPHGEISLFNEESYGKYWPGGRDSSALGTQRATEDIIRRFINAGAGPDTILNQENGGSRGAPLKRWYPELFERRAAELSPEVELELVEVLRAAIEANNTDVIDRIIGTSRQLSFPDHQGRPGKRGGSLPRTDGGVDLVDHDEPLYPKDKVHWSEEKTEQLWHLIGTDKGTSAGVKFAMAFEHHHQINLAKPNFLSIIGALTGFSDMGRAIGLEGNTL